MRSAVAPITNLAGRPRVVLVLATALLASTAAIQAVPGVLGPFLESNLHITQTQLGLLSAALTGGMALGFLPGGLLTDRFGERTVMTSGVAGAGLVMFAATFTSDYVLLGLLFLIVSIGAAFAATGGAMTITRWFAPNRRGTAMGVRQTGVPLGGLIASISLPAIALAGGWRDAARFASLAAIVVALAFWVLYRDAEQASVQDSVRLISIYRNRRFLAATACALTLQTAQACTLTYLTVDLHQTLGLSAAEAALFLATSQIGAAGGRIAWGAVGDRVGNRRTLTLISVIATACCLLMAAVDGRSSLVAVGVLCFVLGMAAMSWNAVYISLIAALAPQRSVGSALGSGLSLVLLGFLAAPIFGRVADSAHSFRPAWLVLALIVAVGVGLSFVAKTPAPHTLAS